MMRGRYLYGMTKAEHVAFWCNDAADDWADVQRSLQGGAYVHGLFFAHLVIEKISKAHWIKDNPDNTPPRTHNIVRLWATTQLAPTDEQIGLATELNRYQLEGRYPEYMRRLRGQTTAVYATQLITEIATLRTWLLKNLPSPK